MKVGIFGGSFNPPHKGHLKIAKYLINKQYVDKIIFVPTGSKYKYKNNLIADKHRYKMVELMIKDNRQMEVSSYELKEEVVYTWETLSFFQNKYPHDEIYFICGTDNLSYLDTWKNGLDILKNYKILVVDREGNDINNLLEKYQKYRNNIVVAPLEPYNISSTAIRDLVKNHRYEELESLLAQNVIEYIEENKLYESK